MKKGAVIMTKWKIMKISDSDNIFKPCPKCGNLIYFYCINCAQRRKRRKNQTFLRIIK